VFLFLLVSSPLPVVYEPLFLNGGGLKGVLPLRLGVGKGGVCPSYMLGVSVCESSNSFLLGLLGVSPDGVTQSGSSLMSSRIETLRSRFHLSAC